MDARPRERLETAKQRAKGFEPSTSSLGMHDALCLRRVNNVTNATCGLQVLLTL